MIKCNGIKIPLFTKDQIELCHGCSFISGKKRWCGHFGVFVKERSFEIQIPAEYRPKQTKRKGCAGCGKTIKNIIQGSVSYAIEKTTGLEVAKYEHTDDRIRECHKCDEQTWMTKGEYAKWLKANGIEVLKNLDDLTALAKLPKYAQDPTRRNLYCRLCKCFIPAKARIAEMKCPLAKWSGI